MNHLNWRVPLFVCCALCIGCSESGEPIQAPQPAVPIASAAAPVETSEVDDSAGNEPVEAEESTTTPTVAYQAPFPERTELFLPPQRDARQVAQVTNGEDRVQLQGFVTVDEPRAILTIDGNLAPLAVGAERFGVEVVSIEPPNVVLKRGSARWTASLAQ